MTDAEDADVPVEARTLDALYRRYAPYVGAIALRLSGHPADVDDIVQEVFLAAHGGLKRREHAGEVRRWLAVVTARTTRRRLKRARAFEFFRRGAARDYADVAATVATPAHRALLRRVYTALDDVVVDNREAWLLRHAMGHSLEEVAELGGCSLATAKRRIGRAERALQEVFDDAAE